MHKNTWNKHETFMKHGNGPQIYEHVASNLLIDHRSMNMLLATCP